jgi:hypothetical protein
MVAQLERLVASGFPQAIVFWGNDRRWAGPRDKRPSIIILSTVLGKEKQFNI